MMGIKHSRRAEMGHGLDGISRSARGVVLQYRALQPFFNLEVVMPSKRFAAAIATAEQHLLLLLARTRQDTAVDAEALSLIDRSALNWTAFIETANGHGVLSLCHRALTRLHPDALTAETHAVIQKSVMNTAMRNLEMTNELTRLNKLLTDAGISLLSYKGPTLATIAYGGVGLRQFTDLDLLVPPEQLLAAKTQLMAQNYVALSDPEHRPTQKEDHDRSYQGYDLVRRDGRVTIDLQMRFGLRFSTFDLDFATLWAGRQPIQFGNRTVYAPSLEDYLLVLCAHGSQHRWSKLKWICDISELVQAAAVNWDSLLKRAQAMEIERMIYIGLLLAHEALDMPLPEAIRTRIFADSSAVALALHIFKWLFVEAEGFAMLIERARLDYSFDLAVRKHWDDKIACMLFLTRRRLFPRRE